MNLKRIVLLSVAFFSFPCLLFGKIWVVYETNKGPNGFDKVEKTCTTNLNELNCYNPGYNKCEWVCDKTTLSDSDLVHDFINELVHEHISEGQTSGEFEYNFITVNWSYANNRIEIITNN